MSKACAQWLVAGVTGHSTARVSEPLYGSHVKVRGPASAADVSAPFLSAARPLRLPCMRTTRVQRPDPHPIGAHGQFVTSTVDALLPWSPSVLLCAQIYDFKNLTAYTNYSTCVAAQPARSISQAWELWKNRVIFSYSGNITVANTGRQGARVQGH